MDTQPIKAFLLGNSYRKNVFYNGLRVFHLALDYVLRVGIIPLVQLLLAV